MEAARIDGASEWRLFFKVVLPLGCPRSRRSRSFRCSSSGTTSSSASCSRRTNQPIAPEIASQLRQFGSNLDVLAPASFFSAIIPLTFFALFQRYFVQGLLAGSVK